MCYAQHIFIWYLVIFNHIFATFHHLNISKLSVQKFCSLLQKIFLFVLPRFIFLNESSRSFLLYLGVKSDKILTLCVTLRCKLEPVQVDCVPAEYPGQELIVHDVLEGGDIDAPSSLVEPLVSPVRVHSAESVDETVVLSHVDCVKSCQTSLLTSPSVT